MNKSVDVHVFKVFVDSGNHFGNPVGIVSDTPHILDERERVKICQLTGFSEVVFIEDIANQRIRIYNPQEEIDFSGHAGIGTASYFVDITKASSDNFSFRNGIATYSKGANIMWLSTDQKSLPPWNLHELATADEVEKIELNNTKNERHVVFWAWQKDMRTIRARTFAPDWGIPEDEANGSGALLLTTQLKQSLSIVHGKGSIINTKYELDGSVALGGRVSRAETLRITL